MHIYQQRWCTKPLTVGITYCWVELVSKVCVMVKPGGEVGGDGWVDSEEKCLMVVDECGNEYELMSICEKCR